MNILIKTGTIILNIIYSLIGIFTKRNDRIVMISRQSNSPSMDFMMLAEQVEKDAPNVSIVFLCKVLKKSFGGMIGYFFHMFRQMYELSISKVAIVDSYSIAVSILHHKEGLKIIQMWHSIGSMKKFGYSILDSEEGSSRKIAKAMKMHQNYDYVLASSYSNIDDLASGFNVDKRIIKVMPLPRVDRLKDDAYASSVRNMLIEKYPQLNEKKNILYCPTFRTDESELKDALTGLIDAVKYTEYNLIVKLHPLSEIVIEDDRVIVPKKNSTFDIIFVADYIISDYSCVVYEGGIRDIPLYFYAFDLSDYEEKRGLAIDYENECPGMVSQSPKEIMDAIEKNGYDHNELKRFTDRYVQPTEFAVKGISDFVLTLMREGVNE